jgi:hypothetical protein
LSSAAPSARPPFLSLVARPGLPLGAIFLGLGLVAAAAVSLLPLAQLPVSFCFFKAMTGLPCMTCGTTRALARLAAADPAGALAMNPLATLAGLAVVPWGIADLVLLARGRALVLEVSGRAARLLRFGAVAAVLVNWVYLLLVGR